MVDEDEEVDIQLLGEFETPRGNALQMKVENPFGFIRVNYRDGGEIPSALAGSYTNVGSARTAIQNYIREEVKARRGYGVDKEPPVLKKKEVKAGPHGKARPAKESPTLFS